MKYISFLLLTVFMLIGCATSQGNIPQLYQELLSLESPNYTGGLSRRNRQLAEDIREKFSETYPQISCEDPNPNSGTLVAVNDDLEEDPFDDESVTNLPPSIRPLVDAFNHQSQEVRDTAAYTMGLFGPSGHQFVPFLRKRFAEKYDDDPIKGDWHSDAYGKIECLKIASASFQQVIPDHLLPDDPVWSNYLKQAAILMAELYLDPDIEYPLGMMGDAYGRFAIADQAGPAVPLFLKILESKDLSLQKKYEVVRAISFLKPEEIEITRSALAALASIEDLDTKYYITEALLKLSDPHAVELLIDRMAGQYSHWAWEDSICEFGVKAIAAETRLLEILVAESEWPTTRRAAAHALGCIKSEKSILDLIDLLQFPDWETQETISIALGQIGLNNELVSNALSDLAQNHWSKRVREAADTAQRKLGENSPSDPDNNEATQPEITETDGLETITIKFGPTPVDHGLSWCNDQGQYSIDGVDWFYISWIYPGLQPVPSQLSTTDFWDYGTRQFFAVDDGWLFGSDLGHYDGKFQHISTKGVLKELDEESHADILAFVELKDQIFAFGYQVLAGGDGGSLFEVFRDDDGSWNSKRVAALPSPPFEYSISPSGDLLLSDGPNQYAIIDNHIIPLQCKIKREGNYFYE